jgi:hypothetical protein
VPVLDWLTFGLIEPGVRTGSGRPASERGAEGATELLFDGATGSAARGPGSQMTATVRAATSAAPRTTHRKRRTA